MAHIIFPNPIVHYDPKSLGFGDIFQNLGILFGIFVVLLVFDFWTGFMTADYGTNNSGNESDNNG